MLVKVKIKRSILFVLRFVASRVVESTLAVVRFKKKRKTKEEPTETEESSEEEVEAMGINIMVILH